MGSRARNILRTLQASTLKRTAASAGVALAYHRIGRTTGSREHELVAPYGRDLFEAQLDLVEARYRPVPPTRLHEAALARRRGEPFPLAITFDDDLPSHARLACEPLERRGLPAAFFVCGASLSEPYEFWWERLQRLVDSGRVDRELVWAVLGEGEQPDAGRPLVKRLAGRIQRMTGEPRARVETLLHDAVGAPPDTAGMRAADVAALARAGFEIGFHTRRHRQMTLLGDDELDAALTDGRAELEELAGARVTAISYPHGLADARVAAAARRAGFEVGFTGRPESVRPGGDPLLQGRVEPSYRSAVELAEQLDRALVARPERAASPVP